MEKKNRTKNPSRTISNFIKTLKFQLKLNYNLSLSFKKVRELRSVKKCVNLSGGKFDPIMWHDISKQRNTESPSQERVIKCILVIKAAGK